jgi:UDP-N-acetyl-D-galactosamine dehydrogenase
VVFEPTVYPGCTEEDCLPILEKTSGLKVGVNFKIGYSPERINPGDKLHTLQNVVKVVSGCDAESLDVIAKVYELVAEAGVYRAPSIKVAEAAKVIENAQRDLNIALMNELSIIFDKMDINTYDVLKTAATKWNFLQFSPGLVGGHCIGVDPYYLTYKSAELGYASKLIAAGRGINDGMAAYVTKKILQHIIQCHGNVKLSKVLVMGATFKENVGDIRNSKVVDVVKELLSYHIQVDVVDPFADTLQLKAAHGFHLAENIDNEYDVVLIAVVHDAYKNFGDAYFKNITKAHGLVADLKGFFRDEITSRKYWSL